MLSFASKLYRDEGGATAIEYALIATFIAIVIVAAVGAAGDSLQGLFIDLAESF